MRICTEAVSGAQVEAAAQRQTTLAADSEQKLQTMQQEMRDALRELEASYYRPMPNRSSPT